MTRNISAYIIQDSKLFDISWLINRLHGKVDPRKGGVKISGTGTGADMSSDLVFNLSRALWHEGFPCNGSDGNTPSGLKSKKPRCQSVDHTNGEPYKSGTRHPDGGYALKHATL